MKKLIHFLVVFIGCLNLFALSPKNQFTENQSLFRSFFRKKYTQVQGLNGTLIISTTNHGYGKGKIRSGRPSFLLAKELIKHGVDVLQVNNAWARDNVHVFTNMTYKVYLDCISHSQGQMIGGEFLIGKNFIIHVAQLIKNQKKKIRKIYDFETFHLIDLKTVSEWFKTFPGLHKDFIPFHHIDLYYNIGNTKKVLFSYDHKIPIKEIMPIAKKTGYRLILLPLEEAKYFSIGFIELGDHMVIDRRAKKTIKIISDLGYHVIKIPKPFKAANLNGGSIRCRTNIIPVPYKKLIFSDRQFKTIEEMIDYGRGIFFNLEGYPVKLFYGTAHWEGSLMLKHSDVCA